MADDLVNMEIDGVPVKARKGEMIIRVTDAQGVYVPRFCYHDKLTVAANCRMCLVEVEKAPKPMPACATPVMEGMKVFTRSPRAIGAQRATMEFLLINHPLDCPICDQGGECELQDLAVGFGRDGSRYQERKRVVADENLGPLIATDMTRCIHCTRCIRFTDEIAGIQELGMIGRGEQMKVRTYIESVVNHELSGNVIDLCPVGALVSKPYRFSARAWEMGAVPLISPHDPVGTNVFGHVLRGHLQERLGREVLFLHGGTSKTARDEMVERFQSGGGPPLLVLSLKAGGTGLNLTAANHVVHFDRWWNPAVEDQATDRAFRIGQRKNVQVRKLTCIGTLEERIDTLITQKKALAERIVGSGERWITELDTAQLRELVTLSSDAVQDAA